MQRPPVEELLEYTGEPDEAKPRFQTIAELCRYIQHLEKQWRDSGMDLTPQPQDETSGINAVFGKWPRKMTDAEAADAMDSALGKVSRFKAVAVFEEVLPTHEGFEDGVVGYDSDDGDMFRTYRFSGAESGPGLFADLKSSSDGGDGRPSSRGHPEFEALLGKKVRITVEVEE